MPGIILDNVKNCVLSAKQLTHDEISDLIALVEVSPQPIPVLNRLIAEIELMQRTRGEQGTYKSATSKLNDSLLRLLRPAISEIRSIKDEKVGEFIARRSIENPADYLAGLREIVSNQSSWGEADDTIYLTLARRFCIMSAFQKELSSMREVYGLKTLLWDFQDDLKWIAPDDLNVSLTATAELEVPNLEDVLSACGRYVCRKFAVNPEDGYGVVAALLAFDPKPEDLLRDSPLAKVITHFASQKASDSFQRVRIDTDETGLLGGLLIALGHLYKLSNATKTELPESIREWIDFAETTYNDLGLVVERPEDVDSAIESVGGKLSCLHIPTPYVQILPDANMTDDDILTAWRAAKSRLIQLGERPAQSMRKWEGWNNYDEQITFYKIYTEENATTRRKAIYRAMARYNEDLASLGKAPRFLSLDISGRDQGRELVKSVEMHRARTTI